jgi:outer membrane murein-binding lipoprotein Lpp
MIRLPDINGTNNTEKINQLVSYIRILAEEVQRLQLKVEEKK